MRVVTKVETVESPKTEMVIASVKNETAFYQQDKLLENLNISSEVVKGRRYINKKKEEICIGMTKEVQELLGIPFDEFTSMRDEIERLTFSFNYTKAQKENFEYVLKYTRDKIKRANFWKRLLYLFTKKL